MGRCSSLVAAILVAAVAASTSAAGTQLRPMQSHNWSGYLENGGPFALVSATFNVPNLTAARTQTMTSEWVGVDGTNPGDHSLIQAGVRETFDPKTKLVDFNVWWEILPAPETLVPMTISAGDRMHIAIGRVPGGKWRFEISNLTRGEKFATVRAYAGPGRTADWIVEAPSDLSGLIQPLGHFVPDVTFSKVGVLGKQGALQPIELWQGGRLLSQVSRVQANGFSVSYRG